MQARIELLEPKRLVGISVTMSLTRNTTGLLWGSFIQRRKELKNRKNVEFISMQLYGPTYFFPFSPDNEFVKWAAVEVDSFDEIPSEMKSFTLKKGLYAVFIHKGSSKDHRTFEDIFTNWLPNSVYEIDHRPHFEILGAKYKNDDPDSEEEIWIPIKPKLTRK